ncbi:uncharacterized protein LOC128875464 [Hylaeus volcanicus]|uniref:uncharacterized protein LOC128875464 n=1 Tax=Hylaeus volcanicus TaxID=313075 RepID=UPI0023B8808A|nr:uncharacterized protein LOC128875464 [Hylaeus volcanicus]
MKTFAENPFFFFVDNVPPIFSADASEDSRKIVELLDTGCDARVPAHSHNPDRHYRAKMPKLRGNDTWRLHSEEQPRIRSPREAFRGQGERTAMDPGKLHSVVREDENGHQHCWKHYPTYNEYDDPPFRKNPERSDIRTNWRTSPDRTSPRHWNHDSFHNIQPNAMRDDSVFQTRPRPKTGDPRSQFVRSNHSKIDSKIYDQGVVPDRERIGPMRPEYQDVHESERLDHWQRRSTFVYDANPPHEEISRTPGHGCNPTNSRISSSQRSNATKRWEEAHDARSRSRTCSPPQDRRNRARSFSKSQARDPEDPSSKPDSRLHETSNSQTPENLKRFVDRAVDRDSLSEILNSVISSEDLPRKTPREDRSKLANGFWEFIPMDDQNNGSVPKGLKIPSSLQRKVDSRSSSATKRSMSGKDGVESKKRTVLSRSSNDSPLTRPLSAGASDRINHSSQLNKLVTDMEEKLNSKEAISRIHKCPDTVVNLKSDVQSKFVHKHAFGWTGRSSRYLKRSNSKTRSELNADKKKKKTVDDGPGDVIEDKKPGMNFVEKTAARLKRKLDGSKTDESSLASSQCSRMVMEKKVRSEGTSYSKLPIRIGNRFRSKNPIASRFRTNLKSRLSSKEANKPVLEMSGDTSVQSSVRSRTKPRIKPSVEHHIVIVDSGVNLTSTEDVQFEIKKSVGESQRGQLKSTEVNADKLVDGVADMKRSSKTRLSKDGALGVDTDESGLNGFKALNVEQDQRKRDLANRFCGRDSSQRNNARNGFKEKYFFGKPVAIKSRL